MGIFKLLGLQGSEAEYAFKEKDGKIRQIWSKFRPILMNHKLNTFKIQGITLPFFWNSSCTG
jgi:hypothetical protein